MTGCDEERERIREQIAARARRVDITPEWRAEQQMKQEAYGKRRADWRTKIARRSIVRELACEIEALGLRFASGEITPAELSARWYELSRDMERALEDTAYPLASYSGDEPVF